MLARTAHTAHHRHDANVDELAADLGVSTNTVRRLVAAGEIPYLRVGRQLRFSVDEVKAALRGETHGGR